jgi:hypothetical protein
MVFPFHNVIPYFHLILTIPLVKNDKYCNLKKFGDGQTTLVKFAKTYVEATANQINKWHFYQGDSIQQVRSSVFLFHKQMAL